MGAAAKWVGNVLANFGDFGNIPGVPNNGMQGPSQTGGPVLKYGSWAANLSMHDINGGYFTIASGAAHAVAAGGDVGLIAFGNPIFGAPWGFYVGVGLGTLKATLGVSELAYAVTSCVCVKKTFQGWSDLSL